MGFKTADAKMKLLVRESAWGWGAVDQRMDRAPHLRLERWVELLFFSKLCCDVASIAVLMARTDCQLERILDHPGDN